MSLYGTLLWRLQCFHQNHSQIVNALPFPDTDVRRWTPPRFQTIRPRILAAHRQRRMLPLDAGLN